MNKLKEIRISKMITQEELARKCNVTLRTIQNIENNNAAPNIYLAIKIKNALNCDIEDIFIDSDSN